MVDRYGFTTYSVYAMHACFPGLDMARLTRNRHRGLQLLAPKPTVASIKARIWTHAIWEAPRWRMPRGHFLTGMWCGCRETCFLLTIVGSIMGTCAFVVCSPPQSNKDPPTTRFCTRGCEMTGCCTYSRDSWCRIVAVICVLTYRGHFMQTRVGQMNVNKV